MKYYRISIKERIEQQHHSRSFEDIDHNLWLGLDNGISILNLNSPLTVYTDFEGKIGAVYTTINHNGILYVGQSRFVCRKIAMKINVLVYLKTHKDKYGV